MHQIQLDLSTSAGDDNGTNVPAGLESALVGAHAVLPHCSCTAAAAASQAPHCNSNTLCLG